MGILSFRWVNLAAFLAGSTVIASTGASFAKCDAYDPRIADQVHAINQQWKVLHDFIMAAKFVGKDAERGKCAITLLKIGAPAFALPPDEAVKEAYEEVSCLELEKWQLEQECKCRDAGMAFSRDDKDAAATLQAYEDVEALRKKATKIGIPNPAIRSYVERAEEIKACFDKGTVGQLRAIERALDAIVDPVSSSGKP